MTEADRMDNKRLAGAFDVLIKEVRTGERDLDQAIGERDAAEECLSQMYYVVTGRSPEWSNNFGHEQAIEDVGDAVDALKSAVKGWRQIKSAPKDCFILVYCTEDNSRWLAKWQGQRWYGVDDMGLTREGHSKGDPDVVTGWEVDAWLPLPDSPWPHGPLVP